MRKYIIVLFFFIGIITGMINNNFVVSTLGNNSSLYYHGLRGENQISISFNVDWGEEYIPQILSILKKYNLKATFFLTGRWAANNLDLVRNIYNEEHEIGNHGMQHMHLKNMKSENLKKLIKDNENLIFSLCGYRMNLFAPPYGEVDKRIVEIASELGYNTIMWSADTIDWQRPDPRIIIERALNKIDDGGIILMHPTEATVKALPEIIQRLDKRSYNIVKISTLIR